MWLPKDTCHEWQLAQDLIGISSRPRLPMALTGIAAGLETETDLDDQTQDNCTIEVQLEAKLALLQEKYENVIKKQDEKLATLEAACEKQKEVIAKHEEDIQQLHAALKNFHANRILPRFSVCTNALHEFWYSPPFYSHPSGYKLRLQLRCTTPVLSTPYDITCQLQIIPGEHDDSLQWPVYVTVIIEVTCHQKIGEKKEITLEITQAEKPKEGTTPSESKKEMLMKHIYHKRPLAKAIATDLVGYSADIAVVEVNTKVLVNHSTSSST